jgi:hypothetical protein
VRYIFSIATAIHALARYISAPLAGVQTIADFRILVSATIIRVHLAIVVAFQGLEHNIMRISMASAVDSTRTRTSD